MEIKEMLDALEVKLKCDMDAKAKEAVTVELKALNDKYTTLLESKAKETNDAFEAKLKEVKDSAAELKSIVENLEIKAKKGADPLFAGNAGNKSFVDAFAEEYNAKKDQIDMIVKNGGKMNQPLVFNLKAAVPIEVINTIGGATSASHYQLTTNTGIVSTIRKRILTYLQAVSIGSISVDKPYAMWTEELDEQGLPIFIAEGAAKTQVSVRYEEREKKAKKIGVYGKVTTEMLRYLPQLISYITTNLVKRMDIATEDQLFTGDGTGNNLSGLTGYASAFAPTADIAANIVAANEFDVLNAIATQVQLAYGTSSAVFINPSTLQKMKAIKSSTNEPLYKDYMDILGSGDMIVSGQRIIATPMVAPGSFVGGDLSVVHVGFTMNSTIEIDRDGNDFTNNMKTILVEQELVQFVSANDTQCLVKGTFAAAITAILHP